MVDDFTSTAESMSLEEINELLNRAKALAKAKSEALAKEAQEQLELVSDKLSELREIDSKVAAATETAKNADNVFKATIDGLREEYPDVFHAIDDAAAERDRAKAAVKETREHAATERDRIKSEVMEAHGFDIFEVARRAQVAVSTGNRGRPRGSREYPEPV